MTLTPKQIKTMESPNFDRKGYYEAHLNYLQDCLRQCEESNADSELRIAIIDIYDTIHQAVKNWASWTEKIPHSEKYGIENKSLKGLIDLLYALREKYTCAFPPSFPCLLDALRNIRSSARYRRINTPPNFPSKDTAINFSKDALKYFLFLASDDMSQEDSALACTFVQRAVQMCASKYQINPLSSFIIRPHLLEWWFEELLHEWALWFLENGLDHLANEMFKILPKEFEHFVYFEKGYRGSALDI